MKIREQIAKVKEYLSKSVNYDVHFYEHDRQTVNYVLETLEQNETENEKELAKVTEEKIENYEAPFEPAHDVFRIIQCIVWEKVNGHLLGLDVK